MFKRGTLASERIDGTEESDELHGGGGNDGLFGYGGVDNLYGDEGQDWLDGGEGGDGMDGGLGWDTYIVDNLFDIVRDTGQSSEQNTVRVQVDFYELTAVNPNIQVVVLVEGSAARSFYCNSYNTTIDGNSYDNAVYGYTARDFVYGWAGNDSLLGGQGNDELHGEGPQHITGIVSNDSLDGGAGDDFMVGGPGDDSYTIDSAGDSILEYPDEGTDTVFSYISWELEYQVDNLVLYGSTDLTGIGTGLANTINGNLGNNALYGLPGNDQLYGHAGNDQLDGGTGSDLLEGGAGNDTYYVDTDFDRVRDPADGGFDTVFTSATFRLHQTLAFIEELRTTDKTATTAIDLFGSDSANLLEGNAGVNILDGRGGADVMSGLGGNDSYFVNHASDRIIEGIGDGIDTVSASANYTLGTGVRVETMQTLGTATTTTMSLTGNELVNVIIGNAGINALNGSAGADLMRGLAGTDIYVVDNAGDVADEAAAGSNGMDLVQSAITFSLSDTTHARGALENLTLIGTAAINATGNTLSNTLTGNVAVNTLNGLGGADYLRGLGGNDTYLIDNAGDAVDEATAGSGGIDTVQSSVTFNLSDTVHAKGTIDHVTLTGAAAINATGNGLGNTLTGNGAANILIGRLGLDTMTGGTGNDTFRFDTAPSASNYETITDFDVDTPSVADSFDTIELENAVFTQLTTTGDLAASKFMTVASNTNADNGRTITYVSSTGGLFYDTNGATAGGATLFAILDTGLNLTAADFFVT